MQNAEVIIVYFTIYSVIGWICEVIYCSLLAKRLVNRGFLAGPYCPVYGFGALFIIWILEPIEFSIPIIFISSIVITSTVEYITGWLLETFFATKWWDYSQNRFNLEGRVCLKNSVYFGIMSVLLVKVVHPFTEYLVSSLPALYLNIVVLLLLAAFTVDSIFTLNTLVNLNERLKKLYEFTEELRRNSDIGEWFNEKEFLKSFEKLKIILEEGKAGLSHRIEEGKAGLNHKIEEGKAGLNHKLEEGKNDLNKKLRENFEALTSRNGSVQRLFGAFPHMRSIRYNVQLSHLKEILQDIKRDLKQKVSK